LFSCFRNDNKNTFTSIFGSNQSIKEKIGKSSLTVNHDDTHERIFGQGIKPYVCECLEEDTFNNVFGTKRQAEISQCTDC